MNRRARWLLLWLLALGPVILLARGPVIARADIFELRGGGQVRGEIVNKDQTPRTSYVVKTASGGQVALDPAQIKQVAKQSAAEIKYDRLKAASPDTVKGHWTAAEWCRENLLNNRREEHLRRIIELEPDHAEARRALGYVKIQGKWATEEERMTADGRVRYKGAWRLPQEVELMERARKEDLAQKDWFRKVKRWHGWMSTARAEQGRANLLAINDPFAAKGLAWYLAHEEDRENRLLFVEALGNISAPLAKEALVGTSLNDLDEEVRIACFERLVETKYKPAVRRYVQGLKSKDNATVNVAATGLNYMQDPSAISSLIDALITTHTRTIQPGGNPGQMSSTFGTGGTGNGGMSFGAPKPVVLVETFNNQEVLRALVSLTKQNFDYDVKAWKYWYASQQKASMTDARRDNKP